jgi:hypothetical protein
MDAWVVKVADAMEARKALTEPAVRGIIYPMPITDPVLLGELACYRVTKRSSLGPVLLEYAGFQRAFTTISDGLVRFGFSSDSATARDAFATEALRALEFLVDVVDDWDLEYRCRFITHNAQESRPHYDTTALSMIRTLIGPGTWIHRADGTRFLMDPFDVLVLKGTAFPARAGREALLHDYPTSDAPGATERGRVVMIVRTMHWQWTGADAITNKLE